MYVIPNPVSVFLNSKLAPWYIAKFVRQLYEPVMMTLRLQKGWVNNLSTIGKR